MLNLFGLILTIGLFTLCYRLGAPSSKPVRLGIWAQAGNPIFIRDACGSEINDREILEEARRLLAKHAAGGSVVVKYYPQTGEMEIY